VITSIQIENFRGIREGLVEDLAPLTILTGPNGCGKSSVLDAILIGANPRPADALGIAVIRHSGSYDGSRWLFKNADEPARLRTKIEPGLVVVDRKLHWQDFASGPGVEVLWQRQIADPHRQVVCEESGRIVATTWFGVDNRYVPNNSSTATGLPFVRIIDPSIVLPLDFAWGQVDLAGQQAKILELMRPLVPGLQNLVIVPQLPARNVVYLMKDSGSVPVSFSGDGIQASLQVLLELAYIRAGGCALVEEPEVFQHPRSLIQIAQALVEAVRNEIQVVVTTHSLDLIDAIVGTLDPGTLEKSVLLRLALKAGRLGAVSWRGHEIAYARDQVGEDLR
jgi:AAA ATPase domain